MLVFRNGQMWNASAFVPKAEKGSWKWMAIAIAGIDASVDMAIKEEG